MKLHATDCDMCNTSYKVDEKTNLCIICAQAKENGVEINPYDISFANGLHLIDLLEDALTETEEKLPHMNGVWISPRKLGILFNMMSRAASDLKKGAILEARDKVQLEASMVGISGVLNSVLCEAAESKEDKSLKDIGLDIALKKSEQDGKFHKKEMAADEKMREFTSRARLPSKYDLQ